MLFTARSASLAGSVNPIELSDDAWKAKYTEIAKEKMGKDLAPKDPDQWTWDDFEATAYFFTKEINPDSPTRYGAVLQMKNLLFNMMVWHSTARSNGGNWMDAEGNITVDSPAYRTALELYKRLYDAGVTPKDSTTYEYAEANAAFKKSFEADPTNLEALYFLGNTSFQLGQYAEAAAHLEKYVTTAPATAPNQAVAKGLLDAAKKASGK